MKVLQSSSKGKGGRGKFHGSHDGGRGRNSQNSKRESNRNKEDERFSARFTDPRFKLSQQMRQRSHSTKFAPETELHRAAASDPRFASRLTAASPQKVKSNFYLEHTNHANSKSNKRVNGKHVTNTSALHSEEDEDGSDESDIGIEEYEYVAEDGEAGYEHNGVFVGRSTVPSYDNFSKSKVKRAKEATANAANNADSEMEEIEQEEKYDDEDEDEDVCAWAPESVEWTEPRYRLAVVDCDWDHIRAVDLYAILFHALPMGGQLKEVSVYLSEFGKKMLEHERMYGPDLWIKEDDNYNISKKGDNVEVENATVNEVNVQEQSSTEKQDETKAKKMKKQHLKTTETNKNKSHNNTSTIVEENMKLLAEESEKFRDIDEIATTGNHNNHSSNHNDTGEDGQWEEQDNIGMLQECGEDGEYFSAGKYRKYEMDRMKYYYAIATFDSAATASAVYAELDGMDIEASGVVLNLQYVDDDECFGTPVNTADRIPAHFKPLSAFKAAALTQSRFRISWDQEDAFRHFSVQDAFTGTSAEDDLAAYLAPANSDSDNDDKEEEEKEEVGNKQLHNTELLEQSQSKNSHNNAETKANLNAEHNMQSTNNTRRSVAQGSLSKWEEKKRIRQRYAALLAEIGGLPDTDKVDTHLGVNENDNSDSSSSSSSSSSDDNEEVVSEDNKMAGLENTRRDITNNKNNTFELKKDNIVASDDDDDDDDDDDSLNRFSDVEFENQDHSADPNSDEDVNDDDDDDDENNNEMREMEATIDMEIDSKATQLQREIRRRQKLENANLATQAELKYKERRKEMKKTKKELMLEEREAEKAALLARKDEARNKLKALMNVEDSGAIRIAGKQRRKEHARKVKARAADERDALRRRRVASLLGVKDIVQAQEQSEKAEEALESIDTRFQHKLLDDPRFQLEVAQKDKRVATDVVDLAGKVALARRAKRERNSTPNVKETGNETKLHKNEQKNQNNTSKNGNLDVKGIANGAGKSVSSMTSSTDDVTDVVNYFISNKKKNKSNNNCK